MEFDSFVVSLLVLRDDAPVWDESTAATMQDAHLDHLANLHEAGHLFAAGPLGHDGFRGLSDPARRSGCDAAAQRGGSRRAGGPLRRRRDVVAGASGHSMADVEGN